MTNDQAFWSSMRKNKYHSELWRINLALLAIYIGICLSSFRSKLGICQNNARTFQTTDKRSLHGRFSYQVPINRWLWTIWNGVNRSLLSPRFLVSMGEWKTPGECDEIAPADRHAGEQRQQRQHILWRSRFPRGWLNCLGAGVCWFRPGWCHWWGWGREGLYTCRYIASHHQSDSCIKMGSDESHFNLPLTVRDKVTRQCPQSTTFLKRKDSRSGIEPRPFCLPA